MLDTTINPTETALDALAALYRAEADRPTWVASYIEDARRAVANADELEGVDLWEALMTASAYLADAWSHGYGAAANRCREVGLLLVEAAESLEKEPTR